MICHKCHRSSVLDLLCERCLRCLQCCACADSDPEVSVKMLPIGNIPNERDESKQESTGEDEEGGV